MRLKNHTGSVKENLWEYDFWVTPSIVEIRSTQRFREEMARIILVLDALTSAGIPILAPERFAPDLVIRITAHLDQLNREDECTNFLDAFAAFLFLVSGKSDNNNKCQFPIFLKNTIGWTNLPNAKLQKGSYTLIDDNKIPRILDSENYMRRIAKIWAAHKSTAHPNAFSEVLNSLLFQFTSCILNDEGSKKQLSAFLLHYNWAREHDQDATSLLAPLVAFQVRGSVAASGGHEPEELLRLKMIKWGMRRHIDFNTADVVLNVEVGGIVELTDEVEKTASNKVKKRKIKTRAYDFVLPYQTPGWTPRIFIQSQFYAGDSGSVSHKNVDQTKASREQATKVIKKNWPTNPEPVFLEYLDGAGYCASLNGDLESLLSYPDTAGFFQLRSAAIKLRRELQNIGYVTPLEVAHALMRTEGNKEAAIGLLNEEGYQYNEIERALSTALNLGFIAEENDSLIIPNLHFEYTRQHLLLDLLAVNGKAYASAMELAGVALVPGYDPYYGLDLKNLEHIIRTKYNAIWPTGCMSDLQALCKEGIVVLR